MILIGMQATYWNIVTAAQCSTSPSFPFYDGKTRPLPPHLLSRRATATCRTQRELKCTAVAVVWILSEHISWSLGGFFPLTFRLDSFNWTQVVYYQHQKRSPVKWIVLLRRCSCFRMKPPLQWNWKKECPYSWM